LTTIVGWLHGDDLRVRRARDATVHAIAVSVVETAINVAMANVVGKIVVGDFTDSETDGTVGSDGEFDIDIDLDSDWDVM
jgi:hypothetical protein